jgi:hypothetical protein
MTVGHLTGSIRLPTKRTENIILRAIVYCLLLIVFNAGNCGVLQRLQNWFWGI